MRGISEDFVSDLKTGILKDILSFVNADDTLDIEIRENYINIYYRGGNILKIVEPGQKIKYDFDFDFKYVKDPFLETKIKKALNLEDWQEYFMHAKQAMDFFFNSHKKEEREYQQLVVKDNNYSSIANSTDYFIIDIEYDNHKNARFDMVAVEWVAESESRKLKNYTPKLVIIEMKYGTGALGGKAGIKKHLSDFNRFISDTSSVKDFKLEILNIFRQKRELNLIPALSDAKNKHKVTGFEDEIEMVFLLANHTPRSKKLSSEIGNCNTFNAGFFIANFSGYALYKENKFTCDKLKSIFSLTVKG